MKATFLLVLEALLAAGMVSVAGAQSPEVTHNTWTSGTPLPVAVFCRQYLWRARRMGCKFFPESGRALAQGQA